MRFTRPFLLLSLLVGCSGSPGPEQPSTPRGSADEAEARPEPEPERGPEPSQPESAPRLRRFVFDEFLWELAGHRIAWLEEDGTLELLVFSEHRQGNELVTRWHRYRTQVDESVVEELLGLLRDRGVMALDADYRDEGTSDGTVIDFAIQLDEEQKRIHCENLFPPAVEALRRFVEERLFAPYRELARAQPPMRPSAPDALYERDPFGERDIEIPRCERSCCSARQRRDPDVVCCRCEEAPTR